MLEESCSRALSASALAEPNVKDATLTKLLDGLWLTWRLIRYSFEAMYKVNRAVFLGTAYYWVLWS